MKRQHSRELSRITEDGDIDSPSSALRDATDELILSEPEADRPSQPDKPKSREEISVLVKEMYDTNHRPPSEPIILLQLTNSAPVTSTSEVPLQEGRRRQHFKKTKFAVKVSVDKKFVTQTQWEHFNKNSIDISVPLTSFSSITFPSSGISLIKITILEGNNLALSSPTHLASIKIPVDSNNLENVGTFSFSSKNLFSFSHSSVGSLIPTSDAGKAPTNGTVHVRYSFRNSDDVRGYSINGTNEMETFSRPFLSNNFPSDVVDPNNPTHANRISKSKVWSMVM